MECYGKDNSIGTWATRNSRRGGQRDAFRLGERRKGV